MRYMLFTYRDPDVQLDAEERAAVPTAVVPGARRWTLAA
jgi:hypothetical protein